MELQTQRQTSEDSSTSDILIELQNVSKSYKLQKKKPYLLHEILKRVSGSRNQRQEFWALQDISFKIHRRESVALVGRNGAGKSTLLGIIAGAIFPTKGHVDVRGRLGALLELGAGFHLDLTGRENIYLNASLLGLKKYEIEEQFGKIVEFSELQDFIDVPLRNYSSGMNVRLGFAIAIHIHPAILIMDEALSVGDKAFQEKCIRRIDELKEQGKTLMFVSHSANQIQHLCKRVIWLERGKLRMDGPVDEVLPAYHAV